MGVLILLGPPGSGKGTTAGRLNDVAGWVHLSTGEILRQAMLKEDEIADAIRPFMERGHLVPDQDVMQIVVQRLEGMVQGERIILDGVPRTIRQAEMLDAYLQSKGQQVDCIVLLDVGQHELIARLLGRLTCMNCRSIYHLTYAPPRQPEICDRCGEKLSQRDDDVVSTIRERLHVYHSETEPLVAYYESRSNLLQVDAVGDTEDMVQEILKVVGNV